MGRRRQERQIDTITAYGAVTGSACMIDGALRVGVFDTSESYGHARRARRVGHIAVIGSEGRRSSVGLPDVTLRRNSTKFDHRSRVDLGPISGLRSISSRSRVDLRRISNLDSISSRSRVDLGQPRSKLPVAPPTCPTRKQASQACGGVSLIYQ